MKGNRKTGMGAIFAMALFGFSATAADVVFSYSDLEDEFAVWGRSSKETCDVAIRLTQPELVGSRITGFRVPMFNTTGITDVKVWLSKELTLENKQNVPDVLSIDTEIKDDEVTLTFPEPYTITEEGIYVGYSFTVTETGTQATDKPIALTYGTNPDGFFFHSTRSQIKWVDQSTKIGGLSMISVQLEGDFPATGAKITYPDEMNLPVGTEKLTIPVTVYNSGTDLISSLTFDLSYEGKNGTQTLKFDSPKMMQIMKGYDYEVTFEDFLPEGMSYPQLRLTEINGTANPYADENVKSIGVYTYSELPKRHAVIEEYTGLWCGWCPKGYVSLERMGEEESDFIGVAIHSGDDMQVLPSAQFPNAADGLPTAWACRSVQIDPDYPVVRAAWEDFSTRFAYMDVEAEAEVLDESRVAVTSKVRFVRPVAHDYAVFYYLLGNGMKDKSWIQTNYYSGRDIFQYPAMEQFIELPEKVPGLTFNDVLLMSTDPKGVDGSLPFATEIVPGEWIEGGYEFDLSQMRNVNDDFDLRSVPKTYSVVVGVVNTVSGEIANACKLNVGTVSLRDIEGGDSEVVAKEWYDMTGRRVSQDYKGVKIEKRTLSDGKTLTVKRIK